MQWHAWWPLKSFQLHKLADQLIQLKHRITDKTDVLLLLADLVYVESLMIGELPAEVYHMRIHNQSSTITVLHDSFQILTTVTEHSLTGSMFELGYQYQTHFQGADFFWNFITLNFKLWKKERTIRNCYMVSQPPIDKSLFFSYRPCFALMWFWSALTK